MNVKKIAAVIALSMGIPCVYAAQYDARELRGILAEIDRNGAAPVAVNLFGSTLDELFSDSASLARQSHAQTSLLLEELRGGYWEQGLWESGLGQIELYVNRAGVEKLMHSGNAVRFGPGAAWRERALLSDTDGGLSRIESEILQQGYAEVEAVLNIDGLDYEIDRNGHYRIKTATTSEAPALRAAVLSKLGTQGAEKAAAAPSGATVKLKIGYRDFIDLVRNKDIRHLRSLTDDAAEIHIDETLYTAFKASGQAKSAQPIELIITLRNPLISGNISAASFDVTKKINETTLREVLSEAGIDNAETLFSSVGAAHVKADAEQYARLLSLNDRRIHSIVANKPVAKALLNISTKTLNMPLAWQSGYRGAGQMIAILDNGIQLTHETFRDSQGNSRVVYEGCYGSNIEGYQSICPQQDANGDSPFEAAGSASYARNYAGNQYHGTHVAGIAAGSSGMYPGIAPEAQIVPVQVFSFKRGEDSTAFLADLLAVFEAGIYETQISNNYPLTVNASLGGEMLFRGNCDSVPSYTAFANYVSILKSRQIPVVVPTGNEGSNGGLPFPACIPHTIKVASVDNDGTLRNVSYFSNLGVPSYFTGPIWLAPGGGVTSAITSGSSDTVYGTAWGTSMASPHIAGLYALAKSAMPGYSLDQLTAWIDANFTETVYDWACTEQQCYMETFKAVKIQ